MNAKQGGSRTAILLISIFLSIVLWLLVALNKTYDTNYFVRLKYANKHPYFSKSKLPEKVQIFVVGKGFDLLLLKVKLIFVPVNIDLASYVQKPALDESSEIVLSDVLSNALGAATNRSDWRINRSIPSVLSTNASHVASKKVAVKYQADITAAEGFVISSVEIAPDSVRVSGDRLIINNINLANTEALSLPLLKESTTSFVSLRTQGTGVIFSPEKVQIAVKVERLTEGALEIDLSKTQAAKAYHKIIPMVVKIFYQTTLANSHKITQDDFAVQLIESSDKSLLSISVLSKIKEVKVKRVLPQVVEVLRY